MIPLFENTLLAFRLGDDPVIHHDRNPLWNYIKLLEQLPQPFPCRKGMRRAINNNSHKKSAP